MKLKLVFTGELRSNQRDPQSGQKDKLADHKQKIRRVFHKQLRYFWSQDSFLNSHKVFAADYGIDVATVSEPNGRIPLLDAVASSHKVDDYDFVPLVRKDWDLMCSLDVLFLRHDPPGSVYNAGDLDNRVKTLIDALRMPNGQRELGTAATASSSDEKPFFCLLEDDQLISSLKVDACRYLIPPAGKKDEHKKEVHVVVGVEVRPFRTSMFNLSFV